MATKHIAVCICTYQRPALLRQTLEGVTAQLTEGAFTLSVVVSDNDPARSAEQMTRDFASTAPVPVVYCAEPRRNIALARNMALQNACGDFIAFIDDDEFPEKDWLLKLYRTWEKYQVAGVLGPVESHFEHEPPAWLRKGRFYDRPKHATGFVMPWYECRTGNVLLERTKLHELSPVFSEEYAMAGEDMDFYRRMINNGHQFIWCNEAIAYEVVPPSRWKRKFLLRRAFFRGGLSLQHPQGRWRGVAKAVLAVPAYTLALPFLLIAGHHLFMRYLAKLCDHAGRLLACVGFRPFRERQM
jgi:succinoglycan biosynthesis protein ExoM